MEIFIVFNHGEKKITVCCWLLCRWWITQTAVQAAVFIKRITTDCLLLQFTCDSRFSFYHQLCHRAQSQSALQAITVISIINTTFISLLLYCNCFNLPAYPALLPATNPILLMISLLLGAWEHFIRRWALIYWSVGLCTVHSLMGNDALALFSVHLFRAQHT